MIIYYAKMFSFKFVNLIILLGFVFNVYGQISDKRLCANEDCSQIISLAKTLLQYNAMHPGLLSFKQNEIVKIFSKSAGNNTNLWGVEINNKRGYVPKELIRETKIITNNLSHLVDTEIVQRDKKEVPSITVEKIVQPDPVQKPYELVDGTKIFLNNEENANPNEEHVTNTKALPNVLPQKDIDKIVADAKENAINQQGQAVPTNNIQNEEIKNVQEDQSDDLDDDEDLEDDDDDLEDLDDEDEDENVTDDDPDEMEFRSSGEIAANNSKQECNGENCNKLDIEQKDIELDEQDSSKNFDIPDFMKEIPMPKNVDGSYNVIGDVSKNIQVENLSTSTSPETNDILKKIEIENEKKKLDENLEPFIPSDITIKMNAVSKEDLTVTKVEDTSMEKVTTSKEDTAPSKESENNLEKVVTTTKEDLPDTETTVNEDSSTKKKQNKEGGLWNIMKNYLVDENDEFINPKQQPPTIETTTATAKEEKESLSNNSEDSNSIFSGLVNLISADATTENSEEKANDEKKDNNEIKGEMVEDVIPSKAQLPFFNAMADMAVTPNPVVDPMMETPSVNIMPDVTTQSSIIEEKSETPSINEELPNSLLNSDEIKEIPSFNKLGNVQEQTPVIDELSLPRSINNVVQPVLETQSEHLKNFIEVNANEPMPHFNPIHANEQDIILVDVKNSNENEENNNKEEQRVENPEENPTLDSNDHTLLSKNIDDTASTTCDVKSSSGYCEAKNKLENFYDEFQTQTIADSINLDFSDIYNLMIVLAITAVSVVIFLWGYIFLDKSRREAPLIAKVNHLEKNLLVAKKENQLLNEKIQELDESVLQETVSNEYVENLKSELLDMKKKCDILEEEKQSLEKELENSTEVGMELNRMLTDILSSQNGSETLIANIEQLQRQLVEQQSTINTMNANLNVKDTENHELQLELEICNKKVFDLQLELDKMVENLLKIEEEKEQSQNKLKAEIFSLQDKLSSTSVTFTTDNLRLNDEIKILTEKHRNLERKLDVKCNEYNILKDSMDAIRNSKNKAETMKNLMEVTEIKARFEQLQDENNKLNTQLKKEEEYKYNMNQHVQRMAEEINLLKTKYEDADKHKLEAQTKLEVLQNYFREREAQLQKEIDKHESIFLEKQGEATSTTGRIKFMQSELQNYKSQYESLKQELISQEVELKSQISVLEKKAHENWVSARQSERKLEDMKQEAAQLRNRLTLRERNMGEDKGHNRMQSPLEQNGDLPMSPIHMSVESPSSPPLLYGTREHVTTSPPLPNLPPHFLPPPPFMPPPMPGVPPPFMPPPPSMFPGDHRPPPLGRMSSPPLNSRYSPDSRAYSPYDRNSPSPSYDEDYGSSPPLHRNYSPYNRGDERRDYKRTTGVRNSVRNHKNSTNFSSGSANSNESIEKINGRHHSKV